MTVLSTPVTSTHPNPIDRLHSHADRDPSAPAYTFLGDDAVPARELDFGDVSRASRAVGTTLGRRLRPGDRVMLLLPEGLDFVPAFLGCLEAGVIAVPAYPPIPVQSTQRVRTLQSIVADATPSAVVTIGAPELIDAVRTAVPPLADCWFTSVDELVADGAGGGPAHRIDADDIAFLQYTSGSTAMPKGVTVTHRALAHNEELIADAFGHADGFSLVGWLPLFHDMGLIGNVLHPLWMGRHAVLMSPMSFIKRPARWLQAISTYRATTSGGPNFAYDMCTRRIPEEACEGLDLSSWRVAFNGAEPVRSSTIAEFARRFERYGFDPAAAYPCYGMAEATLLVTGSRVDGPHRELTIDPDALARGRVVEDANGRALVSSGIIRGERTVRIVDPETRIPVDAGHVGEVWMGGPSLPIGYWANAAATEESFRAVTTDGDGPYMRSGDLGFIHDGELYITGRTKDLIIIGGRNHYPHDIEATAEDAHAAVRPGAVAAFGVDTDFGEEVVLVVGVGQGATGSSPAAREKAVAITQRIRGSVAAAHGVPVADVVLVAPNAVPRTSSGKIRRRSCREAYLDGRYADPNTDTDRSTDS